MKKLLKILKWLAIIVALLALAAWTFINFHPVFGGKPDEGSLKRIQASKAYNRALGKFENQEPTPLITSDYKPSLWNWVARMFESQQGQSPATPMPTVPLAADAMQKNGNIVWFGHSTVLFRLDNQTFLTDPVFYNASPLPLVGINPFKMTHRHSISELPPIDVVLISHDHYDHLDYRSIPKIDRIAKRFIVPLGVKAHLTRWGVDANKITEMDWDERTQAGNTQITLVPARHFSGRTMNERDLTLWGGYVIQAPDLKYYYSADSGYGKHYAAIAAQHAPFDLVMIENGAYDDNWAFIHEKPEETLQALHDLGGKKVLPIHWGKFDMANHGWKEPITRLLNDAQGQPEIQFATPKIGQVFNVNEPLPQEKWWQGVE